jgi:hypothetical protein
MLDVYPPNDTITVNEELSHDQRLVPSGIVPVTLDELESVEALDRFTRLTRFGRYAQLPRHVHWLVSALYVMAGS